MGLYCSAFVILLRSETFGSVVGTAVAALCFLLSLLSWYLHCAYINSLCVSAGCLK